MPQRREVVQQPRCQAADASVDRVDADAVEVVQALLDGRQREVVHRPVLERGFALGRRVPVTLHAHSRDRATREPGPAQSSQGIVADEQAPDARRIPEQLVQRDRDEVRLNLTQVEPVRRHECGAVHEHVPTRRLCRRDPLERMLDA